MRKCWCHFGRCFRTFHIGIIIQKAHFFQYTILQNKPLQAHSGWCQIYAPLTFVSKRAFVPCMLLNMLRQNLLLRQISKNDINPRSKQTGGKQLLFKMVFDWRLVKILILLPNIGLIIRFFEMRKLFFRAKYTFL